ncbi:hypothetical protein K3495_g11508 [Podosphaera aphanis]|nr:hypothetical protein K3495_g11508 [Podosphaera aphanis]
MPPKRRLTAGSKARPSKLAKENNLSAAEEQEIQEAFALFATVNTPAASTSRRARAQTTASSSIPIADVRRVLIALSLTPTPSELREYISILDPDDEGYAEYEPFLAICALKMRSRVPSDDDHQREVDEAWELFVGESKEDRITLETLRSVAKVLDEKVTEELLRDMLLEANGGAGVDMGVEKSEFEGVMRRAGVWR